MRTSQILPSTWKNSREITWPPRTARRGWAVHPSVRIGPRERAVNSQEFDAVEEIDSRRHRRCRFLQPGPPTPRLAHASRLAVRVQPSRQPIGDFMLRQQQPEGGPSVATYDPIGERLLRARTIIISGEITQKLAASVSSQLLALAAESESEITVFINSQGGHVEAGDTIHDLMRFIRPRIRMIGT